MLYKNMTTDQQKEYILEQYIINNKSFHDIAKEVGLYANKIRRDAIKYGIQIRNKREAQINALKTGKHSHPTKGKKRKEDTKLKIGMSVMKNWQNIDETSLQQRKAKAKENWSKLSDDRKNSMLDKANKAVRDASKTGSKLEKFLLTNLMKEGHKVDFHKEHILANTRLQIDIFIPTMNIAIEVDGPSHFDDIWGKDALTRNKKYDQKKEGLIIGKGISLIRIKQIGDFSKSRATRLLEKLREVIKSYQSPQSITIEY